MKTKDNVIIEGIESLQFSKDEDGIYIFHIVFASGEEEYLPISKILTLQIERDEIYPSLILTKK
jgi:hypothetical protein